MSEKYLFEKTFSVNWTTSIFYEEFTKDFSSSGESHNYWELVYVDKGVAIATADSTDTVLEQGDIIFHQPNEFHRLRSDGNNALNVFIMTFDCSSPAMEYFKCKSFRLNTKEKGLIGMILDEASNTFFLEDPLRIKSNALIGGAQMIALYLEQLFISLIRGEMTNAVLPSTNTFDDPLVKKIHNILENNLFNSLSLNQICTELNFGRTYICYTFKKATGNTIFEYYNQMKIQKAKELLRDSSMNITQISEILCFCNPYYFTASFKKHVNMTPKQYRKSIRLHGGVRTKKTP